MTARSRIRVAAVVLLALVAGAAVLEVGARITLRARGHPLDVDSRRAWIESVRREMETRGEVAEDLDPSRAKPESGSATFLEPYVAWRDARTEARMIDDAEAYRREDAKAAFDVLLLGGSAASELGANPVLAEALRADPMLGGRELRIHVYAEPGFKEPQSTILLGCLFSFGHEPDLVVAIDGREEARIGTSNAASGVHPLFPSVEHWARASQGMRADWTLAGRIHDVQVAREEARAFGERILAYGIETSAFLGHFALEKLAAKRARAAAEGRELVAYVASRPRDAELEGPRFDPSAEAVASTIAGGWERAVRQMHALCSARGIPFVEILEPIPATETSPAVRELRSAAARLAASGIAAQDLAGSATEADPDAEAKMLLGAIEAGLRRLSIRDR